MKPSVLLLHYSGPPIIGGVERVMAGQARALVRRGHSVGMAVGSGETFDPMIPVFRIPEMDSRHPAVQRVQKALIRGEVPPTFSELRDRIKAKLTQFLERYPTWIAHNIATMPQNLALTAALHDLAAEGRIRRLILWHHDIAWGNPRYRGLLHEGYPWELIRTPWPGRVTHVVISEMRRRQLAELYGIPETQIHVVPNGLDAADFFRWRQTTIRLLSEWELLEADLIFLQPVRITPRKNLIRALEIMHALCTDGLDARLVITGTPDRHRADGISYLQQVLDRRKALGLEEAVLIPCVEPDLCEVTREVVVDLYTVTDALLLTSEEEGFGLPVLEAGISRIPVFAQHLPPLEEVGDGYVYFFRPEDPSEKVAAMIRETLQRDMPGQLRRRIRREFLWDSIYNRHLRNLLH